MDTVVDYLKKLGNALYSKLVFFFGDVRTLDGFPWITYAVRKHEIDFDELVEAQDLIQPGDIGLHRDNGYLSNIAIPGCFKHAWVHIENGDIVEAISDGVVRRNAFYPLYSDLAIVLRPKDRDPLETVERAKELIGENYDVDFRFDLDKADAFYDGKDVGKYDPAFSCTEVAAYSLRRSGDKTGFGYSERFGKTVILADSFINDSHDIVWMSKSVTLERVMGLGLPPAGVKIISEYLNK